MKTLKISYNFVNHSLELANGEEFALLNSRVTSEEAIEIVNLVSSDHYQTGYDEGYEIGYEEGHEAGEEKTHKKRN